MKYIFTIMAFCYCTFLMAQKPDAFIKSGNKYYTKGFYNAAEKDYNKAVNTRYHSIALMNKGNALYKQGKTEDAIRAYKQVADEKANDNMLRSGAYYNAGVVYSNQKKIQESIEQYKQALRLNWQDKNARENLQKALLEQKQSGGGSSQNQQQSKSNMSKSQAQQQLDKLEQKERNTQQKLSKEKNQYGGSAGKDW